MHYWRVGKLPTDERQLQRIARMSAREWANSRDTIAAFFDADWTHKRIESELAKSNSKSTARAEAGSRGGHAKALKNNEAGLANATILLEQKAAFALASSSLSQSHIPSLRSGIDDECASASTPVSPEKQKKPPDKSRGSRLPVGWHPGSDWLQFTRKEGLNDDDAQRELENFRDYWAGIPGSRGTKLDWPATWRNRVREVASRTKRLPRASPTGGSRGEPASLLRAVQRAADRFRAPDDVSRDGAGVFDRDGLVVDIATRRG
jgi:uncharacterized protein YdaU (DUF1376 family)